MDLLCAEGLPGADHLDANECLASLEQWAQQIKQQTDQNHHHFDEDPTYFHNSESFYKMLLLSVVLYEDFGIRYNAKLITEPPKADGEDHFFADSQDTFIHGLIGPRRTGTCSSMPILYIALARRLGYPLKLVTTQGHLFMRWESPTERFNMDATGKGLEKYDDEHYTKWPFAINEQEIREYGYLKSLSSSEELAVFLATPGRVPAGSRPSRGSLCQLHGGLPPCSKLESEPDHACADTAATERQGLGRNSGPARERPGLPS
jgi:hypothetical protein